MSINSKDYKHDFDSEIAKSEPEEIQAEINKSRKKKKNYTIFAVSALFIVVALLGIRRSNHNSVKSSNLATVTDTNAFRVGDVFESDVYTIMFMESGEYDFGNQFIVPQSGHNFIYADFSITNNSNVDQSVGFFSFKCYADDSECLAVYATSDNAMISMTTLSPSSNIRGRVYYEVPINAKKIEIEFETSSWTQSKIYFVVK